MAKAKKFGTFGGVFTPSILTILGVIMYLRFPAIIGQAGLINTIGIIVIAHIISITTSLSVASLSTDKPVQNGGTYFMISRSLGLPIGGTLGFALFVGLSFSVSLYLIGFAESFLQYWNLDNSINTIRITGSIVLLAVTTITFISTSLAIKSQYFIMVAIGLSLLSIFFGRHDFAPTEINFAPLATTAPFMVLFGIFFPAVTGFEAGVSMSGDLQNPKKSLPLGAVMAVGVGFIVYIGLAFFYAFTVDANVLANDPQILFKISLVPALVIAGIWGATLSSALGSILGAPRILQAIAMDKIAPKIFAKGTGKSNEPRNALLLAFVIAEAGILIGELDVIARIVSMFFITTYAFLNLASAIESWSSSDFRPAFKIPKFVSILGTLSAFIVMILLDFLALAGATIVLGLLYFLLQRKELILESGDAWSSFWTNLAKRALLKLNIQKANKRNWRPNIILFSGGDKARPHLIEMGLSLSGKLGALTDFTLLIENENLDKINQETNEKKSIRTSYFSRNFACNNIESGIKSVTSVYGFSGFEPNTVLLGWSKNTKNTDFLVNVLKDFKAKKLNAIFLNYDKNNGFGKKEFIDVWWNGKGRHLSFSLNILRFLQSEPEWRDAVIRILIINNDTSITDRIYRNTSALLNEKRIEAEIKIISDDFGSRTKESLISSESATADLILVGISPNSGAYTQQYIESISNISQLPSSLLILSPSEEFEEINVVDSTFKEDAKKLNIAQAFNLPPLPQIENKIVKGRLEALDADCLDICNTFSEKAIDQTVKHQLLLLRNISSLAKQNRLSLEREYNEHGKSQSLKTLTKHHQLFLRNANTITDKLNRDIINEASKDLSLSISDFMARIGNYIYELPDSIVVPFKAPTKNKEINFKVQFQKIVSYYLYTHVVPGSVNQLIKLEKVSVKMLTDLRNLIFGINDSYEKLLLNPKVENISNFLSDKQFISEFEELERDLQSFEAQSKSFLLGTYRSIVISLIDDLSNPSSIKKLNKKAGRKLNLLTDYFSTYSESWESGLNLINNTLYLDTLILSNQKLSKNIVQKTNEKIRTLATDELLNPIDVLLKNIEASSKSAFSEIHAVTLPHDIQFQNISQELFDKIYDIIEDLPEEIALPELIFNELIPVNLIDYESINSNLHKVGSYYFDTLFYETVYREIEQLEIVINKALIDCKEANSLLLFRINNIQDESVSTDFKMDATDSFYKNLTIQISEEKKKIENALLKNEHNALVYLQNSYSKLFYHAILESEKKISSQQRGQKSKKLNAVIAGKFNLFKLKLNQLIINVLNNTSSGIILSRKYISEKKEKQTQISQVLDIVDSLTPKKKVYNQVPIFYRTLLSSSSKITDEFWVLRVKELRLIKNSLQRHQEGKGGAVLIKGVHGAGKTALSRYVVNHFFKKNNIFWINPPINGSVNVEDFLDELRRVTVSSDDFTGIFSILPQESIIVINDLELWWERSKNGCDVLNKIIELINIYGQKIFFVINCNTHSFTIINQILPFEDNFISIVECSNFNTKQLQDLILSRHKSSGLTMHYKGKTEDSLSQLSLSFLFNSYFNFSEGVPGVALNTWKSNIIMANSESITIKKPSQPNVDILANLHTDWLVVIALFIQHKNIDIQKLARITSYEIHICEKLIANLYNAGIIVSKGNSSYTLGRNIEPILVSLCMEKGII
jgi:amino acid transporter